MQNKTISHAFSLVEMLMALLVASLLMAALAPVMTKRMNENLNVTGEMNVNGKAVIKTLDFNSSEDGVYRCTNIITDGDESYCEGEFNVPADYNGVMKITVIGAGGGGGTAPTAGYTEYTTAGSTNTFTVPSMVNRLEATLISGGAGGGAGGIETVNVDYTKSRDEVWTPPSITKGKDVLITACGGGGGGGGGLKTWCNGPCEAAGGGGSGGFVKNVPFTITDALFSSGISIRIGGQGGRGSHGHQESFPVGGFSDCGLGGGSGGADTITSISQIGTNCGKDLGGSGGTSIDTVEGLRIAATGGCINPSCTARAGNGTYYTGLAAEAIKIFSGGNGNNGGNGGSSQFNPIGYRQASSGGGGGYYGGGGGGATASGGGGGGGGATFFNGMIYASGGGGGGSIAASNLNAKIEITGAGGGGGGGTGGGNGGDGGIPSPYQGAGSSGKAGAGGVDGVGHVGGVIANSPFPSANCHGGNGAAKGEQTGTAGGTGALRITYLDYGTGGSGGGGAAIRKFSGDGKITPSDALNNPNRGGSGANGKIIVEWWE